MKNPKRKLRTERQKQLRTEKLLKKHLEAEADRLWHLAVIKKYGEVCFFNLSPKQAEKHQRIATKCHHYYPKGLYPALRYVIENGVPCCWPDHYKAEKIDRTMIADIAIGRGKKWLNNLNKIRTKRQNWSSFETIDYYKNIIEQLKKVED